MDFGEVLTKAWKIIWKYKVLWIFGIFASCSSGGGNGGGGGGGGSGAQYSGELPPGAYHTFNNIEPWAVALIIAGVILLALIIIVVVAAVSTVGRIGLIQGTKMADEDDDAQLTFGGLFNSCKPFFWRVLGLNLLIVVGYIAILIVLGMVFIFGSVATFGLGLICLLPLCCLLIPVIWVLSTFVEMANVAIVVEDLSVIEALQRGWEVFKDNLGNLILMGLVLVLGGFIVGMILALPLILTIIPLMLGVMAAVFGDSTALATGTVIISGLCCLVYLPVLIVIGGMIRAYIGSAWTLTFLRLTQGPADDELVELPPDEPLEPESLPEAVEEAEEVSEPEPASKADKPAETDDLLPEDL